MGREDECPLCCEELSIQDKNFKPCQCGYQICMWCWHHIKNDLNGLCPNCRSTYSDDPHKFNKVDKEEILKQSRQKKDKKDKKGLPSASDLTRGSSAPVTSSDYSDVSSGQSSFASLAAQASSGASSENDHSREVVDRKSLQNIRVVQRNLIYVIGIPPSIAVEETLRRADYFGQYGRIVKVVVNRNHSGIDTSSASASAYITFQYKEDAKACIAAVDGFYLENRSFRASFGTTKYCNTFLRHMPCSNPDCLYLHEMGDDDDSFTKEQIQSGQSSFKSSQQSGHINGTGNSNTVRVSGAGGPSRTGRAASSPVLPPPSYEVPLSDPRAIALNPTPPPAPSPTLSSSSQDIGGPMSSTAQNAATIAARLNNSNGIEPLSRSGGIDRSISMPAGFPPPSSSPPSSSPLQIIGRGQKSNSSSNNSTMGFSDGAPGLSNPSPFALINSGNSSSSLGNSNSLFAGLGGDSWAGVGSQNDGLSIAAPSLATPPSSSPSIASSSPFSLHTSSLDLSAGVPGSNQGLNDGFSLGSSAVGSGNMHSMGARSMDLNTNSSNSYNGFGSNNNDIHSFSKGTSPSGPSFDQLSQIWGKDGGGSNNSNSSTNKDSQNSTNSSSLKPLDRGIFGGGLMSQHSDAFGCSLFSPSNGGSLSTSSKHNNQSLSGSANSGSRFRGGDVTALLATALPPPSPSQSSMNQQGQSEEVRQKESNFSQSNSYPISKEAVFGDNVQNISRNTNQSKPHQNQKPVNSSQTGVAETGSTGGAPGVSSGMAMLQQMLPGVKLTYGEGQSQGSGTSNQSQGFNDQFNPNQAQIRGFSGSPYQQQNSYSQQPQPNNQYRGNSNSQPFQNGGGQQQSSSIWGGNNSGNHTSSNNGQTSSIW